MLVYMKKTFFSITCGQSWPSQGFVTDCCGSWCWTDPSPHLSFTISLTPALSQPNGKQAEWLPVLNSVIGSRSRHKYLLNDLQGLSLLNYFWWKVKNYAIPWFKLSTGVSLYLNRNHIFYHGPQTR